MSKLNKMAAERVGDRIQLTNKEMTRAMEQRQLCCSGVLVSTNRIVGRQTASQIASAIDAAEWAPSTASLSTDSRVKRQIIRRK